MKITLFSTQCEWWKLNLSWCKQGLWSMAPLTQAFSFRGGRVPLLVWHTCLIWALLLVSTVSKQPLCGGNVGLHSSNSSYSQRAPFWSDIARQNSRKIPAWSSLNQGLYPQVQSYPHWGRRKLMIYQHYQAEEGSLTMKACWPKRQKQMFSTRINRH